MFPVADKSLPVPCTPLYRESTSDLPALLVRGNRNETGCSDYPAGLHNFLQHLRGAALKALARCEIVNVAR